MFQVEETASLLAVTFQEQRMLLLNEQGESQALLSLVESGKESELYP